MADTAACRRGAISDAAAAALDGAAEVLSVAVAPDGAQVAAGCLYKTARVYALPPRCSGGGGDGGSSCVVARDWVALAQLRLHATCDLR